MYYAMGLSVITRRLVDDIFHDWRLQWIDKIKQRQKLLDSMKEEMAEERE